MQGKIIGPQVGFIWEMCRGKKMSKRLKIVDPKCAHAENERHMY